MHNNYTSDLNYFLEGDNPNLMNSCLKLAELNLNIESIIEIIEKINELETEIDLLQLILNKGFNLIPEADYGKIVINEEGSAYFLEKIDRKDDIFINSERFSENIGRQYSAEVIFKKQKLNKKLIINLKINSDYTGAVILFIKAENPKYFSDHSIKK
jgi:hypothetical protein